MQTYNNQPIHKIEHEVIGSCLLSAIHGLNCVQYLTNELKSEYFSHDFTKKTFDVICQMQQIGIPIGIESVWHEYKKKHQTDKHLGDNVVYLLTKSTADVTGFSLGSLEYYCAEIEMNYQNSIISQTWEQVQAKGFEGKITALQSLTSRFTKSKKVNWVDTKTAVMNYLENYQNFKNGNVKNIPYGFSQLDKKTNGAGQNELIIIAARPAVGKTAFGLNIILNAALAGRNIGIISLEMSNNQIIGRLLSMLTKGNYEEISRYKMDYTADFTCATNELSKVNIFFSEAAATVESIISSFYKLDSKCRLDLLVIDYLQLVDTDEKTNSTNDKVGQITKKLKGICRERELPIIALSQLSREGAKGKPNLTHLRDSGNIEQDADTVIFLSATDDEGGRLLDVAKKRDGTTGEINYHFAGDKMQFTEVQLLQGGGSDYL